MERGRPKKAVSKDLQSLEVHENVVKIRVQWKNTPKLLEIEVNHVGMSLELQFLESLSVIEIHTPTENVATF